METLRNDLAQANESFVTAGDQRIFDEAKQTPAVERRETQAKGLPVP